MWHLCCHFFVKVLQHCLEVWEERVVFTKEEEEASCNGSIFSHLLTTWKLKMFDMKTLTHYSSFNLWSKNHHQWLESFHFLLPGSADEDSGVGGSPGCSSASRPTTSTYHACTVCNKKFSRADILRKHVKTHVTSSCTVCGQIFNDKVALAKHQSEVGNFV